MKKNRIIYCLVLLSVLAAWIFTESYNIFIILLILLLLPILSFVYTAAAVRCVSLRLEELPATMIRGEKLTVSGVLENSFISAVCNIRLCMNFSWSGTEGAHREYEMTDIKSMDKIHASRTFRLNHCGVLEVSAADTVIYDILRIFSFRVKPEGSVRTLVMPVLTEPDCYAMYSYEEELSDAKEYSKRRKGDDASEIFDLRRYALGDALNRVHWKLSAKEDELLVKEFSQPVSSSNCILVETGTPGDEEEHFSQDAVYELAYSIGNLACLKEKKFKLAYFSEEADGLAIFDIVSEEELVEAVQIMISDRGRGGCAALKSFLSGELKDAEKLFYITNSQSEELYELEEMLETEASVYVAGDSENSGNITRLSHSTILNVDKDDIRWGLTNTNI